MYFVSFKSQSLLKLLQAVGKAIVSLLNHVLIRKALYCPPHVGKVVESYFVNILKLFCLRSV